MAHEILVNANRYETRVAIVDHGVLQEIHLEHETLHNIVGNIYKGKVTRILPGMQAAFVDIGLEKAAFLHVSDIKASKLILAEPVPNNEDLDISSMLHDGQELLVQITKEPISSKGARLSTCLAVPARYLVYLHNLNRIAISQRIQDINERQRLKTLFEGILAENETPNYILRTNAEGATREELLHDKQFLTTLWYSIKDKAKTAMIGDLLYIDLPLIQRVLRDSINAHIERIRVDNKLVLQELLIFAEKFAPVLLPKIELYDGVGAIFGLYNIEDEIQRALQPVVPLKSGGHIVIEQTEAMTTIDVNTGTYVGKRSPEDTIFKTNLEATQAIARQLRLRNLGGIIIIDFIDMANADHRIQVLRQFEKALLRDTNKSYIMDFNNLGLLIMTRKRTRESLQRLLCESCAHCQGHGIVKSIRTICYEILREVEQQSKMYEDAKGLLVLAAPVVVEHLLNENSTVIAELEGIILKNITLQVEALYTQEQYDVIIL